MKLEATKEHLERAIPAVAEDPRHHTCLCLFAQAINDAIAPRKVAGLCPSSGWDDEFNEFKVHNDVMRSLMQDFDNKDYDKVMPKLPYPFAITFTGNKVTPYV